jgi:hypothetical protein
MTLSESLRDVIGRVVELKPYEAVAIAQQLITSTNVHVQGSSPLAPLSLDNVRLGMDGSVERSACIVRPAVSEIGVLLAEMLPREGTTRVPGALRYTIARALLEVDAPPFDSATDLSVALARHEQGDRVAVLRDLYARAALKPPKNVATDLDRRRRTPSATVLRRRLREADEELFSYLNRSSPAPVAPQRAPSAMTEVDPPIPDFESAHTDIARGSFDATSWALGGTVALLIAFGAGYAVVAGVRAPHVARPAASLLTPAPAPGAAASKDATGRTPPLATTPAPRTARQSGDAQPSPSRGTPRP